MNNEELQDLLYSLEEEESSIDFMLGVDSPTAGQKLLSTLKHKDTANNARREKNNAILIRREAFNQNIIDLNADVPPANFQKLIVKLTERQSQNIVRYRELINKKFTVILKKQVPAQLKRAMKNYPNAVSRSVGFLYKASENYGGGRLFWATPDIPAYFSDGEELSLLSEESCKEDLVIIDKSIFYYHENIKAKKAKEISVATSIIKAKIKTYYDLLKKYPKWYKIIYDEVKNGTE